MTNLDWVSILMLKGAEKLLLLDGVEWNIAQLKSHFCSNLAWIMFVYGANASLHNPHIVIFFGIF